jgi:putative membrane protein
MKAFQNTKEKAELTAPLAKNQGLYNGFLAAGLAFGLLAPLPAVELWHFKIFFLACVVVAGIYGGITAFKKIFFLQALPAAVALTVVVLAGF